MKSPLTSALAEGGRDLGVVLKRHACLQAEFLEKQFQHLWVVAETGAADSIGRAAPAHDDVVSQRNPGRRFGEFACHGGRFLGLGDGPSDGSSGKVGFEKSASGNGGWIQGCQAGNEGGQRCPRVATRAMSLEVS